MQRFPLAAGVLTLFLSPVLAAQDGTPASAPSPAKTGQDPVAKTQEIKRDEKGVPLDTKLQKTKAGLQYCVLREGKPGGAKPTDGDMVKVHYTGWLLDGTMFDTSKKRSRTFGFTVGKGMVILGWDAGLKLMTPGSVYKFIIPYEMAYGEEGRPPVIPAKAPLIFEIELVSVVSRPKMQPLDEKLLKATESGMKYQVLDPGKGDPIVEGDWVVFKVAFFSMQGKLLDWSEDMYQQRGSYPDGPVGKMGLPFLNEAMKLLKPGGKIRCRVPMALSFGSNPPPNLPVGKDEDTMWEIEIVERYKPLPVPEFKMTDKETAKKTGAGLIYEVIKAGKEGGKEVATGSKVKVHYAGWLTNGTLFDSSYKRGMPIELVVDQSPVITGWHEGLKLMKEGAIYRLTIPAELGYGAQGRPPVIPANSTLVFVIEVQSVQ